MSIFSTPSIEGLSEELHLDNPAFIADLHLTRDNPDTVEGFLKFLEGPALNYPDLVILGDYFNYWVGDDAAYTVEPVTRAMKRYIDKGHRIFLMQGNRDFLMGNTFAALSGAQLIRDPIKVTVGNVSVLLSHGDAWCTKDIDYQKLRRKVRSVWWQWCVLRLPLSIRLRIAENARVKSRKTKNKKDPVLTDVVDKAFMKSMAEFGTRICIHGHTHRPAVHQYDSVVRAVLPDWHFEGPEAVRGGWITIENDIPVIHGPDSLTKGCYLKQA